MARSLHQLGALHQDQGEYPQARKRYEQSLAIKQELGNRAGMARSLHQLGRLAEDEGDLPQAVALVAQAFVILGQLGSPDRNIAGRTLTRLREKMGESAFAAVVEAADAAMSQPTPAQEGSPGITREEFVRRLVENTRAVLTDVLEKKGEWWQQLGELHAQAEAAGDQDFAIFFDLLRRLVEGQAPAALTPLVPPPFQEAWKGLVQDL
jgi:tetratricopeptide (TPR) repeat protein